MAHLPESDEITPEVVDPVKDRLQLGAIANFFDTEQSCPDFAA
jgi:hypothetical protein